MAPLVTSSAINKGKTVAPKAIARRRPAAPPKPQPSQQSAQSDQEHVTAAGASQSDPQADIQTSTEVQSSQAPTETHSSSQTPAETQSSSQVPVAETQPSFHIPEAQPLPTPPSTQQPQRQPSPPPPQSTPTVQSPVASAPLSQDQPRSPASIQTGAPSEHASPPAPQVASRPPQQASTPATALGPQRSPSPRPQSPNQLAGQKRKRPTRANAAQETPPVTTASPIQNTTQPETASPQPTAPEVALINGIIAQREPQRAPTAQMVPPPNPPKPRAKRQKKATSGQATAETTDESQATEGAQDAATPAPPVAEPRKPRAKRQTKSAARVVEDEDGNIIETTEPAETGRPAPKPRKPRQKKQKSQQQEGGEGGEPAEGNPDEPIEDPEKHEIDINVITMFDLTRDRGLGKQSEREAKMAAINWEEVHKKRLAEAEAIRAGQDPATIPQGKSAQTNEGEEGETTEETPQNRQVVTGPRLRLDAEGNLVVEEESLRIDRQAEATRNAANLVATEDDDLTRRVNQMSWINERKRDPTDRVPFFKMKSDPWSDEETDRFYEALRMFGTDFFIISKMFPPKTRRQIKLKFVREERLDPDRVNKALAGESTVPMNLESYAEATGQDLQQFKDPRELEEELRIEGEEQREEIARKKKEIEEAKKQRDIQMAAREKDTAERTAQRREKAALKANRRRGVFGNGTF